MELIKKELKHEGEVSDQPWYQWEDYNKMVYVTTLGDQNLILELPWLEKYNAIIDWKEKTLEFQSSPEELAKTFIQSLVQHHEETMSNTEDNNLVLQFIKSQIEPKPTDQL
jgi:hypothetical protein